MPNKISEYRKKHTTKVMIPSGFEFGIQSLSTVALTRMMKGGKSIVDFQSDPETLPSILETSVVDPNIVATGKGDENTLSAEEIDKDDLMFLIDKIIEFSGLKSEEGEETPFSNTEIGKMISTIAYTFHIRPADLLDPNDELPEFTRLFFDLGCVKTVNEFMKDDKRGKSPKSVIDQNKIDELKRVRER